MASKLYNGYAASRNDSSDPDLTSVTVRAIFVSDSYTFSGAHANFSDLTNTFGDGGTGRANGEALASKTNVAGVLDSADPTFASVDSSAASLNAVVLYVDSGTDSTSTLLGYIELSAAAAPSAVQVTINVPAGGWWDGRG